MGDRLAFSSRLPFRLSPASCIVLSVVVHAAADSVFSPPVPPIPIDTRHGSAAACRMSVSLFLSLFLFLLFLFLLALLLLLQLRLLTLVDWAPSPRDARQLVLAFLPRFSGGHCAVVRVRPHARRLHPTSGGRLGGGEGHSNKWTSPTCVVIFVVVFLSFFFAGRGEKTTTTTTTTTTPHHRCFCFCCCCSDDAKCAAEGGGRVGQMRARHCFRFPPIFRLAVVGPSEKKEDAFLFRAPEEEAIAPHTWR